MLVFTLGESPIAINLDNVQLIQLVNEIIPIPRAPDHIIGVANIENSVIPIVDLEVLLTIREREIRDNGIVVIITLEETVFGLYMFNLPRVINRNEIKDKDDYTNIFPVPDDWINGYVNLTERVEAEIQEEEGIEVKDEWVPYISADDFWISLGNAQIIGPAIKRIEIDREERKKREEELRAKEEEERLKAEQEAALEEEEDEEVIDEELEEELTAEVVDEEELETSIFDDEEASDQSSEEETVEDEEESTNVKSAEDEEEEEEAEDEEEEEEDEDLDSTDEVTIEELENSEGISSSTISTLQDAGFKSLKQLRDASLNELTEIKGIGKKTADKIKNALDESE